MYRRSNSLLLVEMGVFCLPRRQLFCATLQNLRGSGAASTTTTTSRDSHPCRRSRGRRFSSSSGSDSQQQQRQHRGAQQHNTARPLFLMSGGCSLLVAASAVAATAVELANWKDGARFYHSSTTALLFQTKTTQMQGSDKDGKEQDNSSPSKENASGTNNSDEAFDIRELWKKHGPASTANDKASSLPIQNPKDFWNRVLSSNGSNNETKGDKEGSSGNDQPFSDRSHGESAGLLSSVFDFMTGSGDDENDATKSSSGPRSDFDTIAKNFLKLVTMGSDKEQTKQNIAAIVAGVRDRSEQGDVEETSSLKEIFDLFNTYKNALGNVADKYVGEIDFSRLTATALLYYLEHEDETKNPSWKRRMHRFCRGIDVTEMDELNDALVLAKLSYADTVEEIREALDQNATPYELAYCNVKSKPGQPAHFLAVQRDQPEAASFFFNAESLHVTLVVRGTKSAADALTDLLCDTKDYQGGKAHSFILGSGRFIADKHRDLILELLRSSGKSKVEITIIGHSLGAGAAAIAGMELNALKDPRISAKVVGFGCPALLSKDLAEKSDFITTVINDADVVPRLSGIAVANLLLNVLEFDWLPYAKRDIQSALAELQARQPMLFNKDVFSKITAIVEPLLESILKDTLVEGKKARLEVELFPPGKCVHLYRDGVGFSGCYVPNSFCSEIDVSRRMIDGT